MYKDPNDERAKAARRKHYQNNKEQYFARNEANKKLLQQIYWDAKNVPCADCNKSYPHYVMDMDHIADNKIANVSTLIGRGNIKKMLDEIAKCEVVCSNCHRARTYARRQDV